MIDPPQPIRAVMSKQDRNALSLAVAVTVVALLALSLSIIAIHGNGRA